jgi:ABC-type uncharacterized transport system auxiliary subunit
MRNAWALAPIALLTMALAGCGTPKPIMYYDLQIPAAPSPSTSRYPIDMVVGRITGPDLLGSSPIGYRTKQNQIGTYQYHRWTEAPVDLIQEKLIRLMRVSGEYRSVNGLRNAPGSELMVRGRLYDFAEVDGDGITGLVSMEFELYNRKTARILWSHFYTGTEPVPRKEVAAVAQALDRSLDRGLKEVMDGLRQYFATAAAAESQVTEAKGK